MVRAVGRIKRQPDGLTAAQGLRRLWLALSAYRITK